MSITNEDLLPFVGQRVWLHIPYHRRITRLVYGLFETYEGSISKEKIFRLVEGDYSIIDFFATDVKDINKCELSGTQIILF